MTQPDDHSAAPPPTGDWRRLRREERRARRAERRAARGGWAGPALGGIVLVVIGGGLLLQNIGYALPERWWALLLLIPAVASLSAALRDYRQTGPSADTLAATAGGAIFVALALALFFGVNWGIFWPVVLILIGAGVILRNYWPRG